MENLEKDSEEKKEFSLKRLFINYIYGVIRLIQKRQLFLYAAQSSFFILMAFVPFLILLMAFIRAINFDENAVLDIVENVAPDFLSSAVSAVMLELSHNSVAMVSVAIISVAWSAAKALQGIAYGMNNLTNTKEERNYFVLRYRAILYTVIIMLFLAVSIIFTVYGENISHIIMAYFRMKSTPFILSALLMFRFIITFVVLVVVFTMIYTYMPNRVTRFRTQLPAGFICAIAWSVFTYLLSIFVGFFDGFSIYGSLYMVFMWMLWLYICMAIFFIVGMCQPMVNYLFRCLACKIKTGGPVSVVRVPDHAWKVAGIGERRKKERKEMGRKKRWGNLGRQFADATTEPVKKFANSHMKIRKKTEKKK